MSSRWEISHIAQELSKYYLKKIIKEQNTRNKGKQIKTVVVRTVGAILLCKASVLMITLRYDSKVNTEITELSLSDLKDCTTMMNETLATPVLPQVGILQAGVISRQLGFP